MNKVLRIRAATYQVIALLLVLLLGFPLWSQRADSVYAIKNAKIYTLSRAAD